MNRWTALLWLWVAAAGAAEPDLTLVPDPGGFFQHMQRAMATLDTVAFEFTQERRLQLFEEPLRSEGVMFIQAPDQIRWEMIQPYQSILLASQRSVAQFEKTDQGWTRLKVGFPGPLRQVMNQMVRLHRGDLQALASEYDMTLATGKVAVITLVPKGKATKEFLTSIEVHMEADLSATREVRMMEKGDETRIVFRQERRNVKFPRATFDQTHPADLAAIRTALEAP